MKTKDRILAEAKRQLNEDGMDQVSIRSIAHALEISPGNLTYHFKNVDTLIYELYLELVESLSASIAAFQPDKLSTRWFYEQTVGNFRIMWEYRFLLQDFVSITRKNKQLKEHFRQLIAMRQLQFRMFADHLISTGIMQQERLPGQYDRFILQAIILADAWISDALVHFDQFDDRMIYFYADLLLSTLTPFLTEQGLREYQDWRKEINEPPFRSYPSLLGES